MLDALLPEYDVAARYGVEVRAPVAAAYRAIFTAPLDRRFSVRLLFALRSMSPRSLRPPFLTLPDLWQRGPFTRLVDAEGQGIALGVAGRFWTSGGRIAPLDGAEAFAAFAEPGWAKSAMAVWVEPRRQGSAIVTETRTRAFGRGARLRFRLYWLLVGPMSGFIRRAWLDEMRRAAEGRGT